MTRRQRSFHRVFWPILAVVVAIGFSAALGLRPAPAAEVSAETTR